MRFSSSNYDTSSSTWWSDNTWPNRATEAYNKMRVEIEKLTKALKLFNRRTLPPPSPPLSTPVALLPASQIPVATFAVRRSPNWRGHTGWVRLGSGRPL